MRKLISTALKCLFLLPFLLFLVAEAYAQGLSVSGKVSSSTGEALPGVTIVVKGSTLGTTSDGEGNFSITVPNGNGSLVFSFIGHISQEVAINNRSTINVTLATDTNMADGEAVVSPGHIGGRSLVLAVNRGFEEACGSNRSSGSGRFLNEIAA